MAVMVVVLLLQAAPNLATPFNGRAFILKLRYTTCVLCDEDSCWHGTDAVFLFKGTVARDFVTRFFHEFRLLFRSREVIRTSAS
jgi:hypothetical protein